MEIPAQPEIHGVVVQPLKLLPNARGRLMEVQRNDEALHPGFGQVYVTATLPGVVKAWYRHRRQVDQITPLSGRATLVLYDGRPESPTHQSLRSVVLDGLDPRLVQIPTGVWHGFQATGETEALLLHLNSIPYDIKAPDEDRLPCDDPSIPYAW